MQVGRWSAVKFIRLSGAGTLNERRRPLTRGQGRACPRGAIDEAATIASSWSATRIATTGDPNQVAWSQTRSTDWDQVHQAGGVGSFSNPPDTFRRRRVHSQHPNTPETLIIRVPTPSSGRLVRDQNSANRRHLSGSARSPWVTTAEPMGRFHSQRSRADVGPRSVAWLRFPVGGPT
jgi:hypothetical protein